MCSCILVECRCSGGILVGFDECICIVLMYYNCFFIYVKKNFDLILFYLVCFDKLFGIV